jgi:uncharacterized membrane protein YfcA
LHLVPGSVSGVIGYRHELVGQAPRLRRLLPAAALGGVTGATLLLRLPSDVFERVVIVLIVIALTLVVFQPRIAKRNVARRAARVADGLVTTPRDVTPMLTGLVFLAGVYGGYFGAAQGVMLMAALGLVYDSDPQRANGAKNILAACANVTAAVVFALSGAVVWLAAAAIALGGQRGGRGAGSRS